MVDHDILALAELGDVIAAVGVYQQRYGGSVLDGQKAVTAALRRKHGETATTSATPAAPPPREPQPTLVSDPELDQHLRAGLKIAAIKRYRELYGVGLKEAKEAIEAIAAGVPMTVVSKTEHPAPGPKVFPGLQPRLDQLIAEDQRIQAVKHYRECTGLGLRECVDAVDARMAELRNAPPAAAVPVAEATDPLQPELDRLIASGQKIMAIKHYRNVTGSSLLDAKNAVEALMASRRSD